MVGAFAYCNKLKTVLMDMQINIFMGLGLLSMPYAMRLSGWFGLAALAALTCTFCLSGKLIVHAFEKMPLHRPHTYPALGMFAEAGYAAARLCCHTACNL